MMTHDDVTSLADLKDKTILVATSGRTTWWPWLKRKYKYTDEQTRPYTFNLQPFFADKNVAQQGYPSSEPFQAKQQGMPVKFFLFARDGYPPYGTTMVAKREFVDKNPDAAARFVKASLEGWKSYMSNPAPANVLIKAENPKMSDEQIAFGIEQMKALKVLDGGDAQRIGLGIMTEPRWKATYDYMVSSGLLKPEVDWKAGFTDRFVKDLKLVDVTRPAEVVLALEQQASRRTARRMPPAAALPAVEVLSAEKVFPNGTRALAPIDLQIADGEFLTLIGPSGCGKSTLLKLIANLIEPTDGRIVWWSGGFDKVGSSGPIARLRVPGSDPDAVGAGRDQCAPAARSRPCAEGAKPRPGGGCAGARRPGGLSRATIRANCPAA